MGDNNERKERKLFPSPEEKYTTSPTSNTVTRGEEKPCKKAQQFYSLREDGGPPFLATEKEKRFLVGT